MTIPHQPQLAPYHQQILAFVKENGPVTTGQIREHMLKSLSSSEDVVDEELDWFMEMARLYGYLDRAEPGPFPTDDPFATFVAVEEWP